MVPPLAGSHQIGEERNSPGSMVSFTRKAEEPVMTLPSHRRQAENSVIAKRYSLWARGVGCLRSIASKPRWLQAIYLLFAVVCLNAVSTYNRQKRLALMTAEDGTDDGLDIHYSAGAEEHVVSQSYGSSMYGGGIHTSRSKSSTALSSTRTPKKFQTVHPLPDGTKDFNLIDMKKYGRSKSSFSGFTVYAMSDSPLVEWQEKRLRNQMAQIRDHVKEHPEHNVTFGVHLGNTQKVSNYLCKEESYKRISSLIGKGPRPTLVVPGKEDWFECPRRSESFDLFLQYYGSQFLETHWHSEHYEALKVNRSDDHPELFALHTGGILFVGVHLLDIEPEQESKTTGDERMHYTREWLAKSVEEYLVRYETRGAVIMGHSPLSPQTRPFFKTMRDYFANVTSRETLPVLYLHGGGLEWKVDSSFGKESKWEAFWDIQIDQSGLADPVWLEIAPQINGKLQPLKEENEMQTVIGHGLYRIDRRGGREQL